jgi:hypothetical protein
MASVLIQSLGANGGRTVRVVVERWLGLWASVSSAIKWAASGPPYRVWGSNETFRANGHETVKCGREVRKMRPRGE